MHPMTTYKSPAEKKFCGPGSWLIPNSIAKVSETTDISDITISLDDEFQLAAKVKGLLKLIDTIIDHYEKGLLPIETKCAEKFAYDYYNQNDLVSPLKGLEEKDFEKTANFASEIKSLCDPKYYFDLVSNKCEKCFEACEGCEIYGYCSKCKDINAVAEGGYCFCKEGFYMDREKGICKLCNENCLMCDNWNKCLKCKHENSVVDNGSCKCLEGFLEVYNPQTKLFSCEAAADVGFDKRFGCYRSFAEINQEDYTYLFSSKFGYSINPAKNSLSIALSDISSTSEATCKETRYCDFDISKEKAQSLKTSFVHDGYIIELEIKATKL